MPSTRQQMVSNCQRQFSDRDGLHRPDWERIWRYMVPRRNRRDNKGQTGSAAESRVYASVPAVAFRQLVNTFIAGLMPRWQPWFQLAPGIFVPEDERVRRAVGLWRISEVCRTALMASNLYAELQPTVTDAASVGTGVLKMEPKDTGRGIRFKNIPIDQIACCESRDGRADIVFHDMEEQNHILLARYGEKIPETLRRLMDEHPYEYTETWSIVWPDPDRQGKYQLLHVLKNDADHPLEERMLQRNPYMVWRWRKQAKYAYGDGEGNAAIYDIHGLNRLIELFEQNAALAVNGAYTSTDDSLINAGTLVLTPGKIISVHTNDDANPTLRELGSSANFEVALAAIERLETNIRTVLYSQFVRDANKTPQTATEVAELRRLTQQEFGATYTLGETELMVPIVENTLAILGVQDERLRGIENIRLDRFETDVLFLAPIAQAMRSSQANTTLQFAAATAQLAALDPSAAAVLNVPAAMRQIGSYLLVDPTIMRSEEEAAELVERGIAGQAMMARAGQPAQPNAQPAT